MNLLSPGSSLRRAPVRGASAALVATFLLVSLASPAIAQGQSNQLPATVIPLQIDEVILREGQLIAIGELDGETVELPITLNLAGRNIFEIDTPCEILNLELGPIFLDVLGLEVETSAICLEIAADPEGGVLGQLLCGLAGGLDLGTPLADLLGDLTEEELADLLDGLRDLLNEVLGVATSPANVTGVSSSVSIAAAHRPVTDILNLAVGPLDLELLGLLVYLHDCEDGPVTVDIRAVGGEGRLLGNLLGNLGRLLDGPASDRAVARSLFRVIREIDRILDL